MKKFLSVFLALILLTVSLTSCLEGVGIDPKVEETEVSFPPELDPDKEDLPSFDDMLKIEDGMTYEEVYTIAGLPQRKQDNMRIPVLPKRQSYVEGTWYFYDTAEGIEFLVAYLPTSSSDYKETVRLVTYFPPEESTSP